MFSVLIRNPLKLLELRIYLWLDYWWQGRRRPDHGAAWTSSSRNFTLRLRSLGSVPPAICVIFRMARVGALHPVFAKVAHYLCDQPIAKAALRVPHLDHAATFAAARAGRSSS